MKLKQITKLLLAASIFLLIVFVSSYSMAVLPQEEQRVWEKVSPSLVFIKAKGCSVGPAVLIDSLTGLFLAHGSILPNEKLQIVMGQRIYDCANTSVDEVTQMALIQAIGWDSSRSKSVVLAKTNNSANSKVLVVASPNPLIGRFITSCKAGVLRPSLRYAPLSEIKVEKAGKQQMGGAIVFNMRGELIGIVAATMQPVERKPITNSTLQNISSRISAGYATVSKMFPYRSSTVAFAQGIEILDRVIEGFLSPNRKPVHPSIGAFFRDAPKSGVILEVVMPNSPSSRAGLRTGDVIIQVNNKKVEDAIHLAVLLFQQKVGSVVSMQIQREGVTKSLEVVVGCQASST